MRNHAVVGPVSCRHVAMTLERIAWSVTIAVFVVATALFLNDGFNGYATLSGLLALAASVNLTPPPGASEE